MSVVAIVQARMASTRLPGKVLKTVLGKPLLQWQLERLAVAQRLDQVVVATTTQPGDDAIDRFCRDFGVASYRGSELDVLDRYHAASKAFHASTVVRVTSDCPLVDPRTVDRMVDEFAGGAYDYLSTDLIRTWPAGLDLEIVAANLLETAWREGTSAVEREHVTPFFYLRPERFRLGNLACDVRVDTSHRWTVDTAEDFELVSRLLTELEPLHPSFTLSDILVVLKRHPDWPKINAGIKQKALGE